MPPVTTSSSTSSSSDSQRESIYGRRRRTASAESLSGSSQGTSCVPGSSGSSASSSKISSSSSRRASPTGNKEAAVIAAAALLAKRNSAKAASSSAAAAAKLGAQAFKKSEKEPVKQVLVEPEYQDECIAHMHHMETETIASIDLMDVQPELKWFMRPYLVDFIVEIHSSFRLRPETLYLTMNIVDRYVSKRIVYKRHYQLVGCASLLIAAKFEDSKDRVPTVAELSQMCCSAYDDSAFTQMEGHVLSTIGWMLGYPTPEAWLRIAAVQTGEDCRTQGVARFLMELTLFPRDFIGILPSLLASGSLMLARYICGEEPRHFDNADEVASAAQVIDTYVRQNLSDLSLILVKKYNQGIHCFSSTIVRTWYTNNAASGSSAVAAINRSSGLLPAQSVNAFNGTSFSTPRRNAMTIDDDDDTSMRSGSASPASMMSTPSRSGDEEEEEDDDDMPVTPLSLNSLHDPLIAAGAKCSVGHSSSASSRSLSATKENHAMLMAKPSKAHSAVFGHAAVARPALAHWDANSRTAL